MPDNSPIFLNLIGLGGPHMKKFTVKEVKKIVGNKIFTIEFIKKDGSLRVMNARLGVTKHLQGGEQKYNPEELNYLTVFDMQTGAYRTINCNTIQKFTFQGEDLALEKDVVND